MLDIYGFRVIVNDIPSCYLALRHARLVQAHSRQVQDYIAIPKSNGYQSLHTTLFGPYGTPIEVQIARWTCTISEAGVASHWMYKSGDESIDKVPAAHPSVAARNPELQAGSGDAIEFLEHVKVDLPDEVMCSPQGPHPGCRKAPPRWILPTPCTPTSVTAALPPRSITSWRPCARR